MRLVSRVWGPEWSDLQYAVLEMDRDTCERLLKLINEVQKANRSNESLLSHTYFDYAVQYFEAFPDPDGLEEEVDVAGGWVPMSEDIGLPEPARIELPMIEAYGDRVHWTAVPKHGGAIDQVETGPLEEPELRKSQEVLT